MPDVLPVRMQDILHCGQPELREGKIKQAQSSRATYSIILYGEETGNT